MSNNKEKRFTHYTDKKGFQGILKEGVIHKSTDTTNDAVYGPATYTTTKDPARNKGSDIAKNNYDGKPSYHQGMLKDGRVDYGIQYTDPTSSHRQVDPRQTSGRDVYTYPGDLKLSNMQDVKHFERSKNDSYKQMK